MGKLSYLQSGNLVANAEVPFDVGSGNGKEAKR
jgi:hypothetical protein